MSRGAFKPRLRWYPFHMSRTIVERAGECMASLTQRYGFRDWRTSYGASDNDDLRHERPTRPHLTRHKLHRNDLEGERFIYRDEPVHLDFDVEVARSKGRTTCTSCPRTSKAPSHATLAVPRNGRTATSSLALNNARGSALSPHRGRGAGSARRGRRGSG